MGYARVRLFGGRIGTELIVGGDLAVTFVMVVGGVRVNKWGGAVVLAHKTATRANPGHLGWQMGSHHDPMVPWVRSEYYDASAHRNRLGLASEEPELPL